MFASLPPRTLRRVLPLLSSSQLVELALERNAHFKLVALEFERRPPPRDAEAAARVLRAWEAKTVDPWLAALLLGCAAHPSGYPAALAILAGEHPQGAEDYALSAIVKMVGPACEEDLRALLREHPSRKVRNAAARALGAAGIHTAWQQVYDAYRAGQLGARSTRFALARMGLETAQLAAWLGSPDAFDVTLACDVLFEQLLSSRNSPREGAAPPAELAPLVLASLERASPLLLDHERRELRGWASRGASAGP